MIFMAGFLFAWLVGQVHAQDVVFRAGEILMVVADASCPIPAVRQKTGGAVSWFEKKSARISRVAHAVVAERDLRASDLIAMKHNSCIQEIAANPKIRIASALTDEWLTDQRAWPAIAHADAERVFYHPLYGIRRSVVVAVVDTGVQMDHPDLVRRMWRSASGFGYDFFNGDDDPSDDQGHGTHVAGLIGAERANGIGVRGIMGEWAQLMPVKTQGKDGGGLLSDLVNGVRWAADQGAEVINLSLAGRQDSPVLRAAIEHAISLNSVVVAAAGNDGVEITPANFYSPAGYAPELQGLVSVGAFDALNLTKPGFSNHSPSYIEISAPGSAGTRGILSTYLGSRYGSLDGTSQSAPMVSGAAALAIGFLKTAIICTRRLRLKSC
ncbi:MAG: S8 family serine peptidase [Calothrix sp. SM1_5_4]|nr:S8 family serine peptidase [Calothrix sp. SM1_5_4]